MLPGVEVMLLFRGENIYLATHTLEFQGSHLFIDSDRHFMNARFEILGLVH
jgi:hypothetical protein